MKSSLLSGLDPKDKKEVEGEFISSFHFRQQVIAILTKDIEAIQRSMESLEGYDRPGWAMYQADRLGEIRAYKKIISLFS